MFQMQYNSKHNITPKTIVKSVSVKKGHIKGTKHLAKTDIQRRIIELDAKMRTAAEQLDFESAIQFRDTMEELKRVISEDKN